MNASLLFKFLSVSLIVVGCSGRTTGSGTRPSTDCGGGACPDSGSVCKEGASKASEDGCNTCACSGGEWLCTQRACPVPECTDGATKKADCNTCTCMGGRWLCTLIGCSTPVCTDGQTRNDGCNTCKCSGGQWICAGGACPPPAVCQNGDTKAAPDGCNTCTCASGQWACTEKACPVVCKDGDTQPAPDGCNTCSCVNGQWGAYTKKACPTPPPGKGCGGWLGNTCTADEYCAYEEGELCGAADASATCQKKPQECPIENAPVCGCDGKTYSSACAAAYAGTGVNSNHACGT